MMGAYIVVWFETELWLHSFHAKSARPLSFSPKFYHVYPHFRCGHRPSFRAQYLRYSCTNVPSWTPKVCCSTFRTRTSSIPLRIKCSTVNTCELNIRKHFSILGNWQLWLFTLCIYTRFEGFYFLQVSPCKMFFFSLATITVYWGSNGTV